MRPGQRVSITLGDGEPITATRVWIVGIGEGEALLVGGLTTGIYYVRVYDVGPGVPRGDMTRAGHSW